MSFPPLIISLINKLINLGGGGEEDPRPPDVQPNYFPISYRALFVCNSDKLRQTLSIPEEVQQVIVGQNMQEKASVKYSVMFPAF